ncbi:MAG TPA: twin-arginine translocation signal domain-containing protein, partial [Epsilonproteobacteria bacterium]|nr:twin-arginine translocation signal domain-containing protein [Campylobacterota bacterium]
MKRRDFITTTALGATAVALTGCQRPEEKTKNGSASLN